MSCMRWQMGELTHLKRPWCWERLKAGGEGDDRGWDGWIASPTQWTWVWVNSRSWWWTGRPGVLQSMGSQRVRHDWVTELNYGKQYGGSSIKLKSTMIWLTNATPRYISKKDDFIGRFGLSMPQCLKYFINVCCKYFLQFSSVAQSCPTLRPHGPQHNRPPCLSPTPGVYSNSCPLSWWCHPTISSSVIPFSSCLQSFPASGSFQMSHLFASGGQRFGVSASASVIQWTPRTDLL